jgi:acid phosphatase type 7
VVPPPAAAPDTSPPLPPRPVGDPIIGAAGDIACDPDAPHFLGGAGVATPAPGLCRMRYTADFLFTGPISSVLPLGDNQYHCGSLDAFQRSYDLSWGRLKPISRPVVGNHEYPNPVRPGGADCATAIGAAGYFDYFHGVGNASGPAGNRGQGWYSYDLGSWHLIALNSNCTDVGGCKPGCDSGVRCNPASPQERWLRADLAAHPNKCTLAYWHAPLFSSGAQGGSPQVKYFWNDLYAAGADVILNGHRHDYERFAPQRPNGKRDLAKGIRQFVAGTGGSSLEDRGVPARNSEVFNNKTFGVLELTLHPSGYDWRFSHAGGGSFTDSGSGNCH